MATRENNPQHPNAPSGQTWIRWGPVVAGAVIGIGVMALLTSLFAAIGGEAQAVADNLHWFGFVSAVVALFIAGLLAGMLSGVRGAGPGLFQGLTAWGLILVVAIAFPFPQALGLLETFGEPAAELGTGPLWAAFLSLVVGAVVAALGGLVGGLGGGRPAEPGGHGAGTYEAPAEPPPGAPYSGQPAGPGYRQQPAEAPRGEPAGAPERSTPRSGRRSR